MKIKSFLFLAALVFLGACASDNTKISPSSIARQAEKLLESDGNTIIWELLTTGTFNCDDELDRLRYAQLQEAKLVQYSVKRYAWWEKSKKWSWRGSYTAYDFCDHYVATVSLTSKGKALVLDEAPFGEKDIDKDLISAEYDAGRFSWGKKDFSEVWPEIPNPFVEPEKPVERNEEMENVTVQSSGAKSVKSKTKKENDGVERSDTLAYEAYFALDFDDTIEFKCIREGKKHVVKVRNIRIIEPLSRAEAEVIVATSDVTDAGRILNGLENGMREMMTASLTYYVDKGWVVHEIE